MSPSLALHHPPLNRIGLLSIFPWPRVLTVTRSEYKLSGGRWPCRDLTEDQKQIAAKCELRAVAPRLGVTGAISAAGRLAPGRPGWAACPSSGCVFLGGGGRPGEGGCPLPRDLYLVGGAWLRFLPAGMSLMLFHCEAIGWATAEWPQGRGDLPVGSFVQ